MSLPDWSRPLLDAGRSRAADSWAIDERGIPSLELMEAASAGLAALVQELVPQGTVVVVCGAGNNGGDGYACSRLLREAGRDVRVLAAGEPRGDAAVQLERLAGERPAPFVAGGLEGAGVVVDALLGTGFAGVPRGLVAEAIDAIGACGAPVVACDVPSGVDASTGEVAESAIRAIATATFHAPKPGLYVNPGKSHAGSVRVIDIGIPRNAPAGDPDTGLIDDAALLALLPRRGPGWTKFTSGHVLVVGGSRGLLGAALLASRAAMRAGAGYVSACLPASQQPAAAAQLAEVMQLALPDEDGHHAAAGAADALDEAQRRGGALVLGPGLGRSEGAFALARDVAAAAQVPLLLDADGLNAHAGALAALAERSAPTVLTPHEGELGRLLGVDAAQVRARRLHFAREAARSAAAVVVLKGDDSLIAAPDGTLLVSQGATPALATAGTGDVLSGVAGALLARGIEPLLAASAAVRLHARAAIRAADRLGVDGVVASDVIAELPRARG